MADESAWSRILIAVVAAGATIVAASIAAGAFKRDPPAPALNENWIGEWQGEWTTAEDNETFGYLDDPADSNSVWKIGYSVHLQLKEEASASLFAGEVLWKQEAEQLRPTQGFPPQTHCEVRYSFSLHPAQSGNKARYQLYNRRVSATNTDWCSVEQKGVDLKLTADTGMFEATPDFNSFALVAGSFFPGSQRFHFVRQR